MVFGHNTNLKLGNITFHVQTEDRGEAHALIDTTVYYHGRVLHRRTNNYFDLLPLNEDREHALKLRLDDQHRTVIEEIRSGVLDLAVPPSPPISPMTDKAIPPSQSQAQASPEPPKLLLELTNAKSWLSGKRARLQVSVREQSGLPVAGAVVQVGLEGSGSSDSYQGQTDAHGDALIEFDLPPITNAEAALVISAEDHHAKGHLRFALRAKPRVLSK
jgi:hypothetical protein